jgi:hypothetical protein
MKDEKPREYPETLEGQASFDRFRALTSRLVNVPKETVAKLERERKQRES